MKKRLIAALLTLCMVVSLLPLAVFAAEEEGEQRGNLKNQFHVELDANGGVFADGADKKPIVHEDNGNRDEAHIGGGQFKKFPQPTHPEGLKFLGWGLTSDAVTPISGVDVYLDHTVVLYAIWGPAEDGSTGDDEDKDKDDDNKGDGGDTILPPETVTITFQVVNGTWSDGETAEIPVTINKGASLTADQIPTGMKAKDGFREEGSWVGGTPNTTDTHSENRTYTFQFDEDVRQEPAAKKIIVIFDLNDGSEDAVKSFELTAESGEAVVPAIEDETFIGWTGDTAKWEPKAGAKTDYAALAFLLEEELEEKDEITLKYTAQYHEDTETENEKKITVIFDINGGKWSDEDAAQTKTFTLTKEGDKFSVPAVAGDKFLGWTGDTAKWEPRESGDYTELAFLLEEELEEHGEVTLKYIAQYDEDTETEHEKKIIVNFHLNGGKWAEKATEQTKTFTLTKAGDEVIVPKVADANFTGWTGDTAKWQPKVGGKTDFESLSFLLKDELAEKDVVTLNYTAQYSQVPTEKKVTLTYNVQGGTPTPDSETKTLVNGKASFKVSSEKITKAGYQLVGWNTEADGTGTSYEAGNTISITEDTTLYAVWEELHLYIVKYKPGTKDTVKNMPEDDQEWSTEEELKFRVSSKSPRRDGYTFKGWKYENGKKAGTHVTCTEEEPVVTLVAQWKRNTGNNPKTGDYIMIAVGVMVVAGAGLAAAVVYAKKKKK